MPSSTSIPIIVQGNSFSLAIPLQIYYINGDQMDLEDYTPDPTDEVSVQLKGSRRNYTYTPTIDGNVANIDLSGNELADNYSVVVSIVKANGQRLRSFRTDQFFIVESSDDLTVDDIIEGLEENVIYLNSSIFVAGEDGRGITSIVKTSTAGLVDTYTITYSDNTTSTFDVTNGAQGEAGVTISTVTTPTPADGTALITLTNGDTIQLDLNHTHEGMARVVIVDTEGQLPSPLDEQTIYGVRGFDALSKLFVGGMLFDPTSSAYERLTAVKFNGAQWLQTDYHPNPNTEFELVAKFTANANTMASGHEVGHSYFMSVANDGNKRFSFYNGVGGYAAVRHLFAQNDISTTIKELVLPDGVITEDNAVVAYSKSGANGLFSFTANGATYDITTPLKTTTSPSALVIGYSVGFALIYDVYDLTIYRFTITEGGVVVRNWMPARYEGEAGLYDTINRTFIKSQTSTPLVPIL